MMERIVRGTVGVKRGLVQEGDMDHASRTARQQRVLAVPRIPPRYNN